MESKDCIESNQQEAEDHGSEELLEAGVFTPPLYKQRYSLVADILRQEGVKSVADFGIAECKVMMYLKSIESLESITGVDIDADLLERFRFLIHPLTTDYLQPRDKPLLVQLLAGNVAQCDHRLADVEAVTLIELVEHLESDTLKTFPENVFGFIAPRLVVITTPNSEYNVLFPNFSGFRHWDHKFEWTRAEFQEWCQSVASRYHYTVTYTGVGIGGKGTEHLGHCSQIAVFTKEARSEENVQNVQKEEEEKQTTETMSYKLVAESRHPCKQDRGWSAEEEILHEAQYYINMLVNDHRQNQLAPDHVIESEDEYENSDLLSIPLEKLLCFHKMKQKCEDPHKLREILEQHGSRLSEDRLSVLVSVDMDDDEDDIDFEDESGSSDCTDNQATERNEHNNFRTLETEDWDEEEDRSKPMYGDGVSFRRTNQIHQQQQERQITEDPVTLTTADSVVIHQGYNYYNFPALRLEFVMRCLVCGGKTKQLHHGKSLMSGINDVCRCVWTQQGSEEFRTAVTISPHTGAVEGQFSDAEDEY